MKLRTQILAFLFLFAFTPLFLAFAINLPLVLDRFEHFYHEAHTQNLRADFRDLDQHLASRYELVNLLSKLPAPGAPQTQTKMQPLVQPTLSESEQPFQSLPLKQYVSWINRLMATQRDIVLLAYLDNNKQITQGFIRNRQNNNWQHSEDLPVQLLPAEFSGGQTPAKSGVKVSPIIIRKEFLQQDPRLFMSLNLSSRLSPVDGSEPAGHLIMTVDVTDFARAYKNTIWVQSDGQYLFNAGDQNNHGSAFDDYSQLDDLFARDRLGLWEGNNGTQVIWVPMLRTASGDPLWVGRTVDPTPIADIQFAISWRVITIMLILVILVFYLSRRFANYAEKFDGELTEGITQILEEDKAINLDWNGPKEIRELAEKLSRLSEVHEKNTQRALHHAHELEASNQYKSEFLANVSHELRTPLNSILLLSKLIKEDINAGQEQIKKAGVIHAAGQDLKSLIDNILDLSRIEAGKTSFSVQTTDLRELLEELVLMLKPQFESKHLSLMLNINPELPKTIRTDANKLRQIMKNFLSNALKFTNEGVVSITAGPEGDERVIFSVQDNGIGIDEDKQSHIFGAFQQADGSINRRHGGTGLGLTISKQLAELMNGNITLSSAPNRGACFNLHLPLSFDTQHIDKNLIDLQIKSELTDRPSRELPTTEPMTRTTGQRILAIDADMQTLLFLTPLLEGWGYKVSGAGDREEALETLESETDINLIMLDIALSEKDGYATIKQLEQDPRYCNIPVITMGNIDSASDQSFSNIKAEITKPLNADKLKSLLEDTIP